ncbi:MAG: tandem-95 repeat protein [Candidatus Neomarinimicrobiota bacterium]
MKHIIPYLLAKYLKLSLAIVFLSCFGLHAQNEENSEPDWAVSSSNYSSNLSLIGDFYLNEEPFDSANIIAAFVDGTVRGTSTVESYGDGYVFLMTIYGNTAGEEIEFKAWIADATEDSVVDIEETIEFVPNGTVGSVSSPQVFTSYRNFDFSPFLTGIVDQSVHMGEGFTSFDLNDFISVRDQDTLLFTATQGDYISVSQADGVITLDPQSGWIGSEDIIFTVTELTENGYSDSDTATFTQLRTDVAPVISEIEDQTVGPNGSFISFDMNDFIVELDDDSLTYEYEYGDPTDVYDDPEWSVSPQNYEFSMSVVAEVFSRGEYPDGAGHVLAAFDEDGVIRGLAQGEAYINDWRYLLTIYSNNEGDEISFRFYDNDNYLNVPVIETVTFVNNSVIGSAATPIDLTANFIKVDLSVEGVVDLSRVDADWTGNEAIIYSITDNGTQNSYSDSDQAVYTVDGNYEPILSGIPDQSIGMNGTFTTVDLDYYTETFDEDGIVYSVSGNSDLSISLDGSLVTVSYESGFIGVESLIFTATDNNEIAFSSSDTAVFSVLADDNIPQLVEVPDLSVDIGSEFDTLDLTNYLREFDGDDVNWSFEFLDYPSTESTPSWEAPTSGTYSMELVATVEALGLLTEDNEHILVAINDSSDILGVSQAINFQGTWVYNMDLFSNEDNVNVKFWFYDNSSERVLAVDQTLVFSNGSVVGDAVDPLEIKAGRILISLSDEGLVSIEILQTNWDIAETVRFTVTDASTENNLTSFNDISIMIENDLPAISVDSWETEEGGSFEPMLLEDYVSDNGTPFDSLTISVATGIQYTAEIVNDYLIVYPPGDSDWNGTEEVTLKVLDAHPYDSKTLETTINFVMTPVNDAPILAQQDDLTIREDEPETFALEITDIDTGEVFSIFVYSDNDSLVVTADSTDSTITASPAADWYGESNITAIVSDGELTDTTEFTITIDPVNDAPRVVIIEDINMDEDTELLVPLEVVNVDTGETLSLFVSSDVGNVLATANSQESTLRLVPEQNWNGQAQITAIVSDGVLAQSVSFTLTVDPVNDRPTVVDKDDEVIKEDSSGTYLFEVADVDTGETLQLFVSSSESNVGVQLNSDNFSITATPTANWHGNADLIVSVSDGELVDTTRFTLTVDPVNDAPIITGKDDETLLEDFSSSYLFEVADIDTGETLVLSVLSDTSGVEVTVDSDLEHQSINVAPILNWHGKSTITVVVSDGELTDSTDFELTVVPINDAPTIADVEDKTMLEDNSKEFIFEIADVDTGETLGILVSSSSQDVVVTADSENHSITAVPNENWHGTTEIEVGVTDYDLITTTTFLLTVTPVNDQPHITQFPDITILEDYTETFKLEVSDVDTGEVLTLFATTDNSALTITADSENNTISVVPQDNWHGNSEVEVIVTDDELVFAMSFLLTVDPVNDAPTISSKEDQTILEDQSGTYLFQVADIDTGEVLSISAFSEFVEVELIANSEDYSITTNPIDNWHGTSEIMVILSDNALTDTSYFDLLVLPVNDAPVIDPIVDQWMLEDDSKAFYFEINDVDTSEIFTLSSFTDQSNVTVIPNSEDQSITAYAHNDWNGSANVTVIVSDGELTDTTAYNLTIEPVNDAPVISDLSDQNILEDELGIYSFEVSDIDAGEDLILAVFSDQINVDATASSEDYTVTLTPDLNWNGTSKVSVILSDGLLTDTTYFNFSVFPVNDAPVIALLPNTTFNENSLLSVDLDFSDVDENDILSLVSFSDSDGVTTISNSSSATLEVISPDFNGDSEITVIVSDGELEDTTSFNVTIAPTNDAPIIAPIQNISILENEDYTLKLNLTDIDLDEVLTVSAYSDTADVIVTSNLGEYDGSGFTTVRHDSTITIRSTIDWHGFAEITVIVSDGELTDIETFQIAVGPVNDAPTIAAALDQTMLEDDVGIYSFEVADIDTGTVLSIFAYSDTNSVMVDANSNNYTVTTTPEKDWYGSAEIMVVVSDNYLTDTTTFKLTVDPANDAPTIVAISDQIMLEDGIKTLPFELADIDTGEVLTLAVFSEVIEVEVFANSQARTITAVPQEDWNGSAELTVIVSDGELTDTTLFNLTVNPVNDSPEVADVEDLVFEENNLITVNLLNSSDVDEGDILTFVSFSDTSGVFVTINPENTFLEIGAPDFNGESEITLIVSDGFLSDTTFFMVTVTPTNDAPIIAPIADVIIEENGEFILELDLTDIDLNEFLNVSAYSDTADVIITPNLVTKEVTSTNEDSSFFSEETVYSLTYYDSTITIRSTPDWHGSAEITVLVSDGELTDIETFLVTFIPANDAPIIADAPDQIMLEDDVKTYSFEVADIDTGTVLNIFAFSDTSSVLVVADSDEFTVTASPEPDWHGQAEIMVVVSDNYLTDTTTFNLVVNPVNDAPIILPAADQQMLEDNIQSFPFVASDIDTGTVLILTAFSDTNAVILETNSEELTVTADSELNWHGKTEVMLIISDGFLTDTTFFTLTVDPVNDAPIIAQAADVSMPEDIPTNFSFEVSDVDTGSTLILSAFSSDEESVIVSANSEDHSITAFPELNWHGQVEITLYISDNELADTTFFTLTVDPLNDAPTIAEVLDQTIFEDQSGTFPMQVADIDTGETLILTALSDQPLVLVSTSSEDGTVTTLGTENWHGDANVTVIVSDGELTDTTSFVLTVDPVNNAPIIADIADGSFLENSEFTTYLNPDDIDTSETLSLYAFSDTSGVTVLINNDSSYYVVPSEEFHGVAETPLIISSPDFYGVSEITVIVSDGFLSDTTSFFVTIEPTNDAPIISPIAEQYSLENTVFIYDLELTDIDTGEVLIVDAFSDTADVIVVANSDDSTLTISTTLDWYGPALITVVVSDGELNDLETFVINFGPVNDAPTISQISDSFIEEDNVFETPIHWADIDTGEVLILTAFTDTNAVALDVNTIDSLFTITPDSAWNGTANIKLFVSDGQLSDSTLFSLTVGPINDAPIITPIANKFMEENSVFELDLELTDIDTGEVLTVSAFSDTSAMVVTANSADSSITAIPADDWNGTAQITVIVSDGDLTDTTSFALVVGPLNDAPVIVQVTSMNIDEDETLLLPVSFSDVDVFDELSLSAVVDTSAIELIADVDSSTVYIIPDADWHGSAIIDIIISDSRLTDTTTFTFTVDPVNDAPIISEASDASTVEDSLYSVGFELTDIDTGEVLILSALADTSAIMIDVDSESSIIHFVPDPDWNGISEITVIVADGELSDTTQFMLTVSNVPDKPYAILQDDINSIQGQVILIDGSESYDIDDDPLQYYWTIMPEDSLFALEGIIGDTVVTETAYLEFQSPIRSSEHKFNIKLWVENTSNLFSDEDSLMLTVQILEANDILPDLSSLTLEAGKAVPITVTIPDGFIVDSISINYADAYSGFISNSMIQQEQTGRSGTEYFYEIPFYLAGLEGLAYYVYVEDPNGSIILTDTTDINLAFNDGVVSSGIMHSEFAYGFPRDVWRMISVPSYLDNSQLESILGDAVGSYSESTWMIYDWNSVEGGGEDGSPAGWIQPTQLLPGKAYWLKQVIADAPTFAAPSGKTVELSGYDIEVDPGWNMISSPYLFPVSVQYDLNNFSELYSYGTNISSEPSIDGYLEGWADSTISVMSPWAGYAIYNKTETVKTIQISPLNKNRRQIARLSSHDAYWSLKIGVQSSKYFDHKNEFGISPVASNKIDYIDSPEPPVFDKYISFYSNAKNSYGYDKKITTDFRNSDDSLKVWSLVLETNIEEESAQIDIQLNGSIGSEVLWLIDMQNGNTFNIGQKRSISEIVSISTQMVNRYKLVYGDDAEVESMVKEIVALIPKEFSLGHNYPNPFNPSTTIPFTISSPGLAAVTVYDVNGRQIKQIVNENFKPGFYSRVWDGKNSNGIPVSSGVYYYSLRTKTFNSFKKMILIK